MATKKKRRKKRKLIVHPRFFLVLALLVLALGVLILLIVSILSGGKSDQTEQIQSTEGQKKTGIFQIFVKETPTPTPSPSPTPSPEPTPSPTPKPTPHYVESSNPERYGYVPHLEVDGKEINAGSYTRPEKIVFPDASEYNALNGILTFRGNNFRNLSASSELNLTEYKLTEVTKVAIGSLKKGSGSGSWSGCGWTGQPLIVQWDEEVKQAMNLFDSAKQKANLVEVIYPTEDGHIYFFDLETGQKTRPDLNFRMPFKGTGSIDPRGLPILYVGSGDEYEEEDQKSRAMIISLIDGRKLYEFGIQGKDSFAKRNWNAYDSAPLVDAATDTLIWPAESGILYTMKLNTVFDARVGTVSVNPSHIVKLRYDARNSYDQRENFNTADSSHKWLGYEGSAVVWNDFIYLASNDGLFQCVDLNTMQIKWIADTLDDTNASPVLDVISETEAYLYVGTSLHFTQVNNKGVTPFFKIDAMTGEIKGQYQLTVETVSGVSGGIQATAALGQNNLNDLVFVPFARYNGKDKGVLVALYKETMEVAWTMPMDNYAWSSPAIFYNSKGDGFLVQADSKGNLFLLDGRTGNVLDRINPTKNQDKNFEASPAIFGNMLVLGSRGDQTIFFIRLS